MDIVIDNIRFVLDPKYAQIHSELPSIYRQFSTTVDYREASGCVYIGFQTFEISDLKNITPIFDDGSHLKIFNYQNSYFIKTDAPIFKNTVNGAKVSRDFSQAFLFCNMTTIQQAANTIFSFIYYPLIRILFKHLIVRQEGCLFHASLVDIGGKGYVFTGHSGVGKSTISRLFVEKNIGRLLNDEIIGIKTHQNQYSAFGTPWTGESRIAVNDSVSLKGIFFLSHGSDNQIAEIRPKDALKRLLSLAAIPWYDKPSVTAALDFLGKLVVDIPMYDLRFKPDASVVDYFVHNMRRH